MRASTKALGQEATGRDRAGSGRGSIREMRLSAGKGCDGNGGGGGGVSGGSRVRPRSEGAGRRPRTSRGGEAHTSLPWTACREGL